MTSATPELRHLLKLLDDESPVVREAVRQQLSAMRDELPERLRALDQPLDAQQQRLITDILAPICQKELEDAWLSWRWLSTPEAQLEEALRNIAVFLSGWQSRAHDLAGKLDALAAEATREGADTDARGLAEFLFGGRGPEARLRGNSRDYYSAQNSNLLWVLENGMGNPISLSCVFLLVGRRLGLKIQGCNFPGHFLARVGHEGKIWLVDCFNRGRFMLAEDVAKHHPAANPSMDEIVQNPATVETIVARMLRNLDDSFEREGNMLQRQTVRRLMLKLMED